MAPFICRGWGVWQGPGCRSTTPQLVKRFLSFLRMAGQENSAGKIITCTHAEHLLKHSRVRREKRQRCFAPRDRKFRMWRFLKAKSSRPGMNNSSKMKKFKTTDEWRWSATVKRRLLLQIAKISEQSEETDRAARKQELISQQNTICTRCRPVISLLPLLIYFLTSAARPLQPKLNPREGRGGGGQRGRKQEMREEGGEVVLTLSSILLHIVIIFIFFVPPSIIQGY